MTPRTLVQLCRIVASCCGADPLCAQCAQLVEEFKAHVLLDRGAEDDVDEGQFLG